jgi:hypothetical protein
MTMSSLTLKVVLSLCVSIPIVGSLPASNAAGMVALADSVSVQLEGVTYVNKVCDCHWLSHFSPLPLCSQGLVGFGLIPSDFKESTGDTLGGIGSAIDIKHGTWSQGQDGTFSGTFVVQPDRGFNVYVCVVSNIYLRLYIVLAMALSIIKHVFTRLISH